MEMDIKDLLVEDGTYGVLGVLIDGEKWYLRCVGYVVGLFVRGLVVDLV